METRRKFLKAAASSIMSPGAKISSAEAAPQATAGRAFPHSGSDKTSFVRWYDVEKTYWNVMARPVMEEYWRPTQFVNRVNIPLVRGVAPSHSSRVRLSTSEC